MPESASRSNGLQSLKRNRDQDAELVERQCWHFLELEVTDFGETQAWGSRAFSGGGSSMLLEGRKGGHTMLPQSTPEATAEYRMTREGPSSAEWGRWGRWGRIKKGAWFCRRGGTMPGTQGPGFGIASVLPY